MSIDTKPRHRDIDLLSGCEPYVIECFARQNGITPAHVHILMKRYGSRRTVLEGVIKEIDRARTVTDP
ncbi:hypothetical protein [Mesorhizobium qingshengii]|uniref:DUF3606 domain-containing protein n=1 Tax=Mesorhizobium qingshengii TaxID=1165689 RepID=A0A1G5ZP01_9HYPH|nr:hypothetical protein [Mesorhizobium qingshengii]SDA96551.1 hypothetical protein SAMN02927914_05670 [Mesorhizobium qingshengii]